MKDSHLTLRLPAALADLLDRWADERDLPRSQVVREAVSAYLSAPGAGAGGVAATAPVPRVTGRELAQIWSALPHIDRHDARRLATDVARARRRLPPVEDPWR